MNKIKNKKLWILFGFVMLAVLIRVPFLPHQGLGYDMGYWFGWARGIHDFGLENVYEQYYTDYVNYPPLMMYILWGIGKVYTLLGGTWEAQTSLFYVLVKIPGLIFDILLSLFIFYIAKREFKFTFRKSLVFFSLIAFNPLIFYNSAYWGQVDVINTLAMLLTVFFLYKKKYIPSWAIFGFSVLMKLQVVAILPLLGFVTLYQTKMLNTMKYIVVAIIAFFFGASYYIVMGKTSMIADTYHTLVFGNIREFGYWAHNCWWLIKENNLNEGRFTVQDVKLISSGIFLGFDLGLLLSNFYRLKGVILFFIAAMLCFSFYILPIGVHDRYLYPFFPLFLIYVMKNNNMMKYYLLLSFTFTMNLLQSLKPFFFRDFFEGLMQTPTAGNLLAVINIVLFMRLSWLALKGAKMLKWKDLVGFVK